MSFRNDTGSWRRRCREPRCEGNSFGCAGHGFCGNAEKCCLRKKGAAIEGRGRGGLSCVGQSDPRRTPGASEGRVRVGPRRASRRLWRFATTMEPRLTPAPRGSLPGWIGPVRAGFERARVREMSIHHAKMDKTCIVEAIGAISAKQPATRRDSERLIAAGSRLRSSASPRFAVTCRAVILPAPNSNTGCFLSTSGPLEW